MYVITINPMKLTDHHVLYEKRPRTKLIYLRLNFFHSVLECRTNIHVFTYMNKP